MFFQRKSTYARRREERLKNDASMTTMEDLQKKKKKLVENIQFYQSKLENPYCLRTSDFEYYDRELELAEDRLNYLKELEVYMKNQNNKRRGKR